MRRVSGQLQGPNFYLKRETRSKIVSPYHHSKSKTKLTNQSSSNHILHTRKTHSFHKNQQSLTACTNKAKKTKKKNKSINNKKLKKYEKYEKQIMQVLNHSASVIQREWRKYLIRKYRKSYQAIQQIKSTRKSQEIIDTHKQSRVNKFEQQSISACTDNNYSSYDRNKYLQPHSNMNNVFNFSISAKKVNSSKISEEEQLEIQEVSQRQKEPIITPKLIRSANYIPNHHRTTSDRVQLNMKQRSQKKKLVFQQNNIELVIPPSEQSAQKEKKVIMQQNNLKPQRNYEEPYVANQQQALQQILKKVQQTLQHKKLKKLLALENSFNNNLVTMRSYKKNIETISQQHTHQMNILSIKKKTLFDNWNQIIKLSKQEDKKQEEESFISNINEISEQMSSRREIPRLPIIFVEDEPDVESQISEATVNLDGLLNINSDKKSIQFEQWDADGDSDRKIRKLYDVSELIAERPKIEQCIKQCESGQEDIQSSNNQISRIKNQQKNDAGLSAEHITPIVSNNQISNNHITTTNAKQQQKNSQKNINLVSNAIKIVEQQLISSIDNTQQSNQLQSKQQRQQQQIDKNNKQSQIKNNDQQIKQQQQKQSPNNTITNKKSPEQVMIQLNKFISIDPDIDYINNWLLEISHFILDNYGTQFKNKLIIIQQPSLHQLYRNCITLTNIESEILPYRVITQKQFQTFQYYNIRNCIQDSSWTQQKKDTFAALTYSFHQMLYEALNRMLEDQLIEGRYWVKYPWLNRFKVRKLVAEEHGKQCLQKAINRVSNIAEYLMFPIKQQPYNSIQQINHYTLILLQQICQIPLQSPMHQTHLINQISQSVITQILQSQAKNISECFSK